MKITIITIIMMLFFKYLFNEKIQKCIITPIFTQLLIFAFEFIYVAGLSIILNKTATELFSTPLSMFLENLVIATPDVGGSKRANTYSKYLNVPLVLCNKTRERANVVSSIQIIGDVRDKNVIIIDDMVDTAGTITKAADVMKEAGARSVRAIASHCVMSGPASERVQNSQLEEIVFTDSIPYSNRCAKVKQLTIADMFAETIRRVMNNESISDQYIV